MKLIECPRCRRNVELEDGGVDQKVYVCGTCGARLRYRVRNEAATNSQVGDKEPKRKMAAEPLEARKASAHASSDEADFRLRWPAEYRCEDGHYVRSKNEVIVDNWLYSHGVCHAYEKAVFDPKTGDTLCSDFFVPTKNLYIEIWGMASREYESRRVQKVELYRKLGCRLLEINSDYVKNIDDVLSREFTRHGRDLEQN